MLVKIFNVFNNYKKKKKIILKEVFLKMRFNFVLTNEIRKASLVIGLKKHIRQNFKLINLAKKIISL